jgi:[ribosomal protein S18]-alanine N-acetyltransferase
MSDAPSLALSRAELGRDLDGILAVDAATFERPWTRAMYEWEWTHSDVARFYVARHGDAVVAYCAGWVIFDELHINNLAVDPGWRRRGVASALLVFVLDAAAAEGAMRATLEVRRSNEPARRLYERFGFAFAGVRAGYYREPVEDALVLWRGAAGPGGQTGGAGGQTGNPDPPPAG